MGIALSPSAADKLAKYYAILEEKNRVMDLTAVLDEDESARRHFLDSLALAKCCGVTGGKVIDIGSGAGFPGLPLAVLSGEIDLTVLDANEKRTGFVSEVAAAIDMDVAVIHARAEEQALVPGFRDSYDFAVSRAVARMNMLAELCLPYVKVGGALVAMKALDCDEELDEAKGGIKTLGGKIEKVVEYTVAGSDVVRRAVIIRKFAPTPKGYPRRFAKIKKSPL